MAEVTLRFRSELRHQTGDVSEFEFSGTVADVKRAAIETFGLDAGSMNAPLDAVAITASSRWIEGLSAVREGTQAAQNVANVVEAFPGAQIVNESNGRMVGEEAKPVRTVGPDDHEHAAYARALAASSTSTEIIKLSNEYKKKNGHDPELLQQMREKWKVLDTAEKAAKKAAA